MSPMNIHKSLPIAARAQLFQQLAQMETAGLPTDRAFAVLALAPIAKQRLTAMRGMMKRMAFTVAGERSGFFTPLEARLIDAAMAAGSPARVYRRLADFYTMRAMQTARIRSRMLLPGVIFLLALCLAPLPALVTGTSGVPAYISQVLSPLILVGLIGIGLRWWLSSTISSSRLFAVPIIGRLILQQNLRDFFASLGLMLEAGISMFDALPIALDTVGEPSIRSALGKIAPLVVNGSTLSQAVNEVANLGDPASRHRLVEFIATGEASGTLPDMLLRHTEMETAAINVWYEQFAAWAPRLVYAAVVIWLAVSLIGGALSKAPVI